MVVEDVVPDEDSPACSIERSLRVLETRTYQEPGSRHRESYHLTPAGKDLRLTLAASRQWGDKYRPRRVSRSRPAPWPSCSPRPISSRDSGRT
jgi:hypothetical protein